MSSATTFLTLPLQEFFSASVYNELAPKQDEESRGSGVFPTLQVFMAAASTPGSQPLIYQPLALEKPLDSTPRYYLTKSAWKANPVLSPGASTNGLSLIP